VTFSLRQPIGDHGKDRPFLGKGLPSTNNLATTPVGCLGPFDGSAIPLHCGADRSARPCVLDLQLTVQLIEQIPAPLRLGHPAARHPQRCEWKRWGGMPFGAL